MQSLNLCASRSSTPLNFPLLWTNRRDGGESLPAFIVNAAPHSLGHFSTAVAEDAYDAP
jgi:hypothetical protein